MTNKKSTKRALITSALAMLMCVAMLIGTTFAWFTDTASTAVNKIQSGTLDVALEMKNADGEWESAEGKTLTFKTADGREADKILWEPGCTYELPELRVVNNGNLALKYKVIITGIQGDAKLNEAIEWTMKLDDSDYAVDAEHSLAAKTATATDSDIFTIKGHMKEDAGNEYQNLTIDGITITVSATQDTVESDSYDNQYDKEAAYAVYPAGVTDEIFDSKTEADYSIADGSTGKAQAVAAYVDDTGAVQYTADIKTALNNGASTIYLNKNASGRLMALSTGWGQTNRTLGITRDITIYANGADFEYGELAINTNDAGKNANFTIKIYDAKNIKVWGATPNDGVTQTVILENCHNEGSSAIDSNSRMFYITGKTGTVNVTLRNCSVAKAEAPVYMNCNGSVTVEGCSFSECASAMKLSLKAASGTTAVTVSNTVFDKCGWTDYNESATYLTEDSSSIKIKTKSSDGATLTLNNVAITNVVGDHSIVVDGEADYSGTTTVDATNVTVDSTAWTKN